MEDSKEGTLVAVGGEGHRVHLDEDGPVALLSRDSFRLRRDDLVGNKLWLLWH